MGWPISQLGDVCNLVGGGTPSKSNESYYGGRIPWATVRDMRKELLFKTELSITEEAVKSSSTNLIPSGSIITATRVGLGKVCILQQDTAINQDLKAVIPKTKELDNSFLYWWLKSIAHVIEAAGTGATVQGVKLPFVKSLEIPLPPIPEQKRIVTILDQAFADIEQARAKTEQNLKNARELFESYLQQVFSQRGEGWVETTLGNEIELLTGFAFKSKEYVTHSDSTPLIRGDNIVQGKLRWDGVKLWANDKTEEYKKYQLEVNDIVIAMDRTWVKAGMKFSKITSKDLPALLVQRVARLRCKDSINTDYLYHLVGSKLFERYVLSIQTGLGVPHISGKQIQSFSFSRPSIDQQKIIVSTMNKLDNEVLKLNEIYQNKLTAIDELKKSILQKAFSGELTKALEGDTNKGAAA